MVPVRERIKPILLGSVRWSNSVPARERADHVIALGKTII